MNKRHDSTYAEAENLKEELATLKDDFRSLRNDIGDILSSVVNMGKSGANDVKNRASDEIEARLSQLKRATDEVRDRGQRAMHAVEHKVEEHPLSSVLVAFGIGLLAGHFLRRN